VRYSTVFRVTAERQTKSGNMARRISTGEAQEMQKKQWPMGTGR